MKIDKMRVFVTLYEEKNFYITAHKLNYSYQNIYNSIKVLEKELGIKLVNKGTKTAKISFTHAGNLAYKFFCSVLHQHNEFTNSLTNTILIGTDTSFYPAFILDLIEHFKNLNYAIQIVDNYNSYELPDALKNGSIDLFFSYFRLDLVHNFIPCQKDKIFIATNDPLLKEKKVLEFSDLKNQTVYFDCFCYKSNQLLMSKLR